jgi:hypothetical protein
MGFPHDPQRPQPLDFAAEELHTRADQRTSRRSTSSLKPSNTALTTTTIVCIECLRPWVTESERWRLKVTEDDEPETVPYCPDCAIREFGAG